MEQNDQESPPRCWAGRPVPPSSGPAELAAFGTSGLYCDRLATTEAFVCGGRRALAGRCVAGPCPVLTVTQILSPSWGRTSCCLGNLKWQCLTFPAGHKGIFICRRLARPCPRGSVTLLGDLQAWTARKVRAREPRSLGTMGPKGQILSMPGIALGPIHSQ